MCLYALMIQTFLLPFVLLGWAIIEIAKKNRHKKLILNNLLTNCVEVVEKNKNVQSQMVVSITYLFDTDKGQRISCTVPSKKDIKLVPGDAGVLDYICDKGKYYIVDFHRQIK